MNPIYERLQQCYRQIRSKTDFVPATAIVLGSGLGNYADTIQVESIVTYDEITDFPVATVEGHNGQFIFGYAGKVPVVCMQGRFHFYEGYSMQDVVLPIRLMKLLGAQTLILSNAAGGARMDMKAGDLMLITGQIGAFVPSPLDGPNLDELGVRFPDMSEIYDRGLRDMAREAADRLSIDLKEGVYVQLRGPQYESPEEVRMCQILGADAIGMSTCCEAIAARHMGMRVLGISCICNLAAGLSREKLSHEDVKLAAGEAAPRFEALVNEIVAHTA